ncbi:MAG: molybdate ABC transporter substrate-binding protein [Cellvibrionaceae bacterium]
MNSNRLLLFVFVSLLSCNAVAEEILVAVAANFSAPMKELSSEFEKHTGHSVRLAFGSSGKLYAQIKNGAPFAVFLSADQATPAALVEEGLALSDSRFTYALGALALWSADTELNNLGPEMLRQGRFRKLAVANARLAPYGAAAEEVLKHLNLWFSVENKLVRGENIAQTFQFVSTGNAELGLVALSQVVYNGKTIRGSAWLVPHDLYKPILQDAVLLRRAEQSSAARELLGFMRGEAARSIIEAHGYRLVRDE